MNDDVPARTPDEPRPESAAAGAAAPASGETTQRKVRFRRGRVLIARIPHPPAGSRRSIVLTVATTALVVGGIVGFTMWFIPYSESVSFCTTCHTMIPQHKAYDASAHSEVACGHCHVAPGVQGWIKAKIGGMQELKALVLNNYPTPIPPIPHADMPSPEVTCMECHSIDRINTAGNPIKLILRPRYESDKANTMQQVAVAIRPTGLGSTRSVVPETEQVATSSGAGRVLNPRGVHWHVATPVDVYATDEQGQTIPLVEYTTDEGIRESFIAAREIGLASNVTPDLVRMRSKLISHTMSCLDCHNMVGHNIPNPAILMDESMSTGAISPSLPYIKRDGLALLNRSFETEEQANKAIDAFGVAYAAENPDAVAKSPGSVISAVEELRRIFNETQTPAMKTVWTSYPDNLGHQRSPGCFRCHDGAHVKVVDGQATDQVIPSTCSTCHTFPQVGQNITGLQLGVPPVSHSDKLYVFSHKDTVPSVDAAFSAKPPPGADCATCHQKSYCENCHNSGAVKVTHDEMLYNHAESVRKSSLAACAYCHQPVYCATCHTAEVLEGMALDQARLNSQGDVPETDAIKPEPSAGAETQG